MSKLVRRLLGVILFGVVVYGFLFAWRGGGRVTERLEVFAWPSFALACSLAFTNYVLRFFKWEYYLAVLGIRGVPKLESFLTFLSGFVLTVTPGKVGEVFKSLVLYQLRKVPIERTAPIVVAERVTDLIGVVVMISVGSVRLPGGAIWASAGALVVVTLLVFIGSKRFSHAFLSLLPKLPGPLGRVGARVRDKVEDALGHLGTLTTPRRLVLPTLLSIAAWSLEGIALYVIVRGFAETPPVTTICFVYATATLAGALIPVPGGLGITEGLLNEQMDHLAHVPAATATAAMFLVRLATLWFAVLVGFVALGVLRAKNPSLSADPGAKPAPA